MTKPLINHLQSRRSEGRLVQEQASPWLRRGIPDLAYGTSALYSRFSLRDIGTLFPTLPTGHRHEVYSPGGGSLDARLPVKHTNRPGGGAKAVESSGTFCLGPFLQGFQFQLWSWALNVALVYVARLLYLQISIGGMEEDTFRNLWLKAVSAQTSVISCHNCDWGDNLVFFDPFVFVTFVILVS